MNFTILIRFVIRMLVIFILHFFPDFVIVSPQIIIEMECCSMMTVHQHYIDDNLRAIENYLKQNSGFDVKLKLNQDGSGKLEVDYKNADELLKLVKMF